MDEIIKAKKKYNRNARFYDLVELPMEKLLYSKWRKKYFSPLKGKILDVGIGTGNNIGYYGDHVEVIGIDFSEKMLGIAKGKLTKSGKNNITLKLMDVENLGLSENLLNPLVKFITGVNINRDTGQNIIKSGMKIIKERNLALFDVFRLFEV